MTPATIAWFRTVEYHRSDCVRRSYSELNPERRNRISCVDQKSFAVKDIAVEAEMKCDIVECLKTIHLISSGRSSIFESLSTC